MSMPKHKCPVKSCTALVHHKRLMCFPHWSQVPLELQRGVHQAFLTGPVGKEHREACEAAIRAMNDLEATK